MVFRNMPTDPTPEEAAVISKIGLMQGPLYENTPEHLCVGTKLKKMFDSMHKFKNDRNIRKRKKMLLLPEGESTMYYDAYCNGATLLKSGLAVLTAMYASSFWEEIPRQSCL